MNERLKTLLTHETILSYSYACIEVSEILLELKENNFKRIIIPSRGAYPFFSGAQASIYFSLKRKEYYKFNLHFNLWLLPYTSDWGNADVDIETSQVRNFWTKILADCIRKENTPYTIFYDKIVNKLGNRFTINTSELKLDKHYKLDKSDDEKFIFVDTAISGRAICEIINAFYMFNLTDFFIILIVDENGDKLKQEYIDIIEREKNKGKLKLIKVEKIFSEDASPILNSGISSLVFPSLIETALNQIPEFKKDGFVGAGLWFIDSVSHLKEYNKSLNGVRGSLHSLISTGINQFLLNENKWFKDQIVFEVENMIKNAGNFNIFDKESTKTLIYDRITKREAKFDENVIISSSHVIRIELQPKLIHDIISEVKYK